MSAASGTPSTSQSDRQTSILEGWSNTLAVMAVAARCQLTIEAAEQDSATEIEST